MDSYNIRYILLLLIIPIFIYFLVVSGFSSGASVENFDGTGLVFNQYPNWFYKKPYNPADWLVKVYPNYIQPECLPYSIESKWGSLENMNYNSQAYRFWRF
jgi:hypothetical protein